MFDPSRHLSSEEVVRLTDGETSAAETEVIEAHLAHCSACRLQAARIEDSSHAVNALYTSEATEAMKGSARFRDRLQQTMAMTRLRVTWWRQPATRLAVAALLFVTAAIGLYQWRTVPIGAAEPGPLPDRLLTPGSIRIVSLTEICPLTDEDLDPDVSASLKRAVLHEYGLAVSETQTRYQIDYLVNPQLGGTSDIRNLWPQPYRIDNWNAAAKDKLEKRLHQMVCERTMDLAEAQREIETDWIAAYKKYLVPPGQAKL